jgi:uncharacterized membrane protein
MTIGGVVGTLAAFLQTVEKIQLLKNPSNPLTCDLNSIFSCTNVLSAWQSSVFGFPNSLMCMGFFVIFASIGLAGWSGAKLPRNLRLGIQALALFVLGFGLWFMQQSIYSIGALCIYCIFCIAGLLFVNATWLRINAKDLPIGERGRAVLNKGIAKGADIFAWFVLGLVVAFAILERFFF